MPAIFIDGNHRVAEYRWAYFIHQLSCPIVDHIRSIRLFTIVACIVDHEDRDRMVHAEQILNTLAVAETLGFHPSGIQAE